MGLTGCGAENQAQTAGQIVKGGSDETGEYIAAANWWKPAPDHSHPAACPGGGSGQANTGPCWVWREQLPLESEAKQTVELDHEDAVRERGRAWPHRCALVGIDDEELAARTVLPPEAQIRAQRFGA